MSIANDIAGLRSQIQATARVGCNIFGCHDELEIFSLPLVHGNHKFHPSPSSVAEAPLYSVVVSRSSLVEYRSVVHGHPGKNLHDSLHKLFLATTEFLCVAIDELLRCQTIRIFFLDSTPGMTIGMTHGAMRVMGASQQPPPVIPGWRSYGSVQETPPRRVSGRAGKQARGTSRGEEEPTRKARRSGSQGEIRRIVSDGAGPSAITESTRDTGNPSQAGSTPGRNPTRNDTGPNKTSPKNANPKDNGPKKINATDTM